MLISHPGKPLTEHLENVRRLGLAIFDRKQTVWSGDEAVRKVLEIILTTHDYGKATTYFQEYIQNTDSEKYKRDPHKKLKSHGCLSAFLTFYRLMQSLGDHRLALIGFMAVFKHHGSLVNLQNKHFFPENHTFLSEQLASFDFAALGIEQTAFYNFLEFFDDLDFRDMLDDVCENLTPDDYFLLNYLYSILISSDKGEAIFYHENQTFEDLVRLTTASREISGNIIPDYKKRAFKDSQGGINRMRESIYHDVEESLSAIDVSDRRIVSINVPTGTGKTLTALNAAFKLRERVGQEFKVIYTLPFTSIIDQNFAVLEDVFENPDSGLLMKHHYLSQKDYREASREESHPFAIAEYLVENWNSDVVVTTFVQFLHTLLSGNNRKLKKFHNLANAIIILDEVQSIPYKYWELVRSLLIKMAEMLGSYLILVTATMPLIFDESKHEIVELAKGKREYFKAFDRIRLRILNNLDAISLEEFKPLLVQAVSEESDKSYLVVLNTINASCKVYDYLKNYLVTGHELVYLSTNIIPAERLARINRIKEGGRKTILISTQLIEAGVDLDFDVVYRDFASLDSVNQTCGRCNRHGLKDKGEVRLVHLTDEHGMSYARYIYSEILLDATKKVIGTRSVIPESDFFVMANEYFKLVHAKKSNDTSKRLLGLVEKLQYEKAFKEPGKFALIPDEFETVDIFIPVDEEAEELYREYCEIMADETNQRKERFDAIKSRFLSHVVSIPEKYYPLIDESKAIQYLDPDDFDRYYKTETGFERSNVEKDFFF